MIRGRAKKIHPVIVYSPIRDFDHAQMLRASISIYHDYETCQEAEEVIRRIINDAKCKYLEYVESQSSIDE